MKKISIVLFFFLIFLKGHGQTLFKDFDKKKFEQKKSELPVLLLFSAKWCGICKSMKNDIFPDTNVSNLLNKNFVNFDIDVDKDPSELSSKYDISGLPAYVFLDSEQNIIYQISGYYETADFSEKINYVLKKIKGITTDFDELNACKDSDKGGCEALLNNFISSGEWKESVKNTKVIFDYAVRNYKIAWNHFNDNRAHYYKILSKQEIENELYILVLNDSGDIIKDAENKKSEPDWSKIEQSFKKYYVNGYQKDFSLLKSLIAYKSGKWDNYLLNKEAAIEFELSEIENSKKAKFLLEQAVEMQELALSFKGLTKNNETKMFELCHKILLVAEKITTQPDFEIYEELYYVCSELDKNEESERYFDLAQELKNKSGKKEKQKESDD